MTASRLIFRTQQTKRFFFHLDVGSFFLEVVLCVCRGLNLGREDSPLSLVVPLFDPLKGADVPEDLLEVGARLVVVALDLGAPVEVDVVLPAVSAIGEETST